MSLFPSAASSSELIEAFCDGGSRGNPGPSGFGAVITGADGECLAELSEFLGVRTNNFAEYSGLLAVLGWALEHGYGQLRVVSDSELMVKQIQGKYKVNSPDLKPLWQLARERIAKLERFEIAHALRHKNKAADALANQAMDRGTRKGGGAAVELIGGRSAVAAPQPAAAAAPVRPAAAASQAPAMLRGFTKGGAIQILGGHTLPDGIFVKIVPE